MTTTKTMTKTKPKAIVTGCTGMVLKPDVFNYIEGDETVFEKSVLGVLAENKQLMAYRHNCLCQCMDTQRDMFYLKKLWNENKAP